MNRVSAALAVASALLIFLPAASEGAADQDIAALKAEFAAYKAATEARIERLESRLRERAASPGGPAAPVAATGADEIERLRAEARLETGRGTTEPSPAAGKVFRGGERAQQALNPEISVTADYLSSTMLTDPHYSAGAGSGSTLRVAGIHIQSEMDPFTFGKFAIEGKEDGSRLGEAYAIFSNMIPGATLTVGKFRQQFGVVNRWHLPGLDQSSFPLALTTILGPGGLNQKGVSVDWNLKNPWADANELTLQVTNAENAHLFAGADHGPIPAALVHLKNFHELSRDAYFEWGLTGLVGPNQKYGALDAAGNRFHEPQRKTKVYGLDLTYFWEPVDGSKYRNLTWRTELYRALKETPGGEIDCAGGYTYLQRRLDAKWEAGLRYDRVQPFALGNDGKWMNQIVPYVNYWQSPWVRTRLEFARLAGEGMAKPENRVNLQMTWSMGPHKHERY